MPSISSEAVKAKTGKGWDEWFAALDKAKANTMDHKVITEMLSTKFKVSLWWSQMVTVEYERARGLREVHETKQGFVASVSRTINVSAQELWPMLEEPARKQWLKNKLEVSSSTFPRSMRGKMSDGSRVEFGITSKGANKCSIAAQHSKLTNAEAVATKKAFWQDALGKLKKLLEGE